MFRMKLIAFVALLGLALVFDPVHSPAQFGKRDGGGGPPGGFKGSFSPMGGPPGAGGPPGRSGFGGGGFKMDPEMGWSMLQRSTQSTGDTVDLGKLDARMRDFSRQRAERDGSIPLPEGGIMTKAQYFDHFARSEAAKAAKAAGGGAPGITGPGAPMVITLGPPTAPVPGGPPGGFPGPGGPGGPGGGEDRGGQRLKEQDRDRDGKITFAEADDKLKPNFQLIDRNGDGSIDLDEYRGYYASRERDRDRGNSGGGPPGGFGGGNFGGGWGDPNAGGFGSRDRKDDKKETVEPKPVAMRYGHLPKDLPDWYDKYDGDKDGQVALHEWRKSGDDITKFLEMDLNSDGLITADELVRFNFKTAEEAKIAALNGEGGSLSRPSGAFAGGRGPSSGSFSLPGSSQSDKVSSSSDKPSDKPSSSKGGSNPFREGGKKSKN